MSLEMAQFGSLIWPTPSTERVLLLRAQPEAEELVGLENEGGDVRPLPQAECDEQANGDCE